MHAIYKQKKYGASVGLGNQVTLHSRIKEEGFDNFVTPWGEVMDDFFSKTVFIE